MTKKSKATTSAPADKPILPIPAPAEAPVEVKVEAPAPAKAPEVPVYKHDAAGIGLVTVDGTGFKYVGTAPARDRGATTPDGVHPITMENSTFTPLHMVQFDRGFLIKDPKTETFYYPEADVNTWEGCQLKGYYLIPPVGK